MLQSQRRWYFGEITLYCCNNCVLRCDNTHHIKNKHTNPMDLSINLNIPDKFTNCNVDHLDSSYHSYLTLEWQNRKHMKVGQKRKDSYGLEVWSWRLFLFSLSNGDQEDFCLAYQAATSWYQQWAADQTRPEMTKK